MILPLRDHFGKNYDSAPMPQRSCFGHLALNSGIQTNDDEVFLSSIPLAVTFFLLNVIRMNKSVLQKVQV